MNSKKNGRKKNQSKNATKKFNTDMIGKLGDVVKKLGLVHKKKSSGYDVTMNDVVYAVAYDAIGKSFLIVNTKTGKEEYTTKFIGGVRNFFTGRSDQEQPVDIKSAGKGKGKSKTQQKKKRTRPTKSERRQSMNVPKEDEPVKPSGIIARATQPVHLVELYDENDQEVDGFVGVYNKTQKKVVSVVSDTYNLLPNKNILDPVLDFFEKNNVKYKFDRFTYVTDQRMRIHFTFPDIKIKDDSKDGILSSLFMHNSYNMLEAFRFVAGAMRLVCSNGMVVGKVIQKVKVVHRADHINEIAAVNIDSIINGFHKNAKLIEQKIQELIATKATAQILVDVSKTVEGKIFAQLMREIGLSTEEESNRDIVRNVKELNPKQVLAQNVWQIYNILTAYISHYIAQRYRVDYLRRISKVFDL